MENKRPLLVTVICVLKFIGISLILIKALFNLVSLPVVSLWYPIFMIILGVLYLAPLIYIWKMKKVGLIAYTGLAVISGIALFALVSSFDFSDMIATISEIIFIGLLWTQFKKMSWGYSLNEDSSVENSEVNPAVIENSGVSSVSATISENPTMEDNTGNKKLIAGVMIGVLAVGILVGSYFLLAGGDSDFLEDKNKDDSDFLRDGFLVHNGLLYKISYPSDWVKEKEDLLGVNGVSFVSDNESFRIDIATSDEFIGANVSVGGDLLEGILGGAYEMFVKAGTVDSFDMLDSEKIILSGVDAHKIVYAGNLYGEDLQWMQVVLVDGNAFYVLSYVSSQNNYNSETILEIIESFELVNSSETIQTMIDAVTP